MDNSTKHTLKVVALVVLGYIVFKTVSNVPSPQETAAQAISQANQGASIRDDSAVIDQLERAWADGFLNHSRTVLERIMAPDFFETTAKGKVRGREETISGLLNSKATLLKIELSETKVLMKGNIAIATGVATEEGTEEDGKPILERVRYTDIFEKRDGKWLAIVEHTSDVK
jgi:ketosteroid isomerase-like protein